MVIQDELQLQEGRRDTLINPLMIAEVLSDSTEVYDPCGICEAARSSKFAAYRTIPSFQEYVLIDQYSLHVEQYYKTEPRKWIFSEYDGNDAILSLNSVPFEIGRIRALGDKTGAAIGGHGEAGRLIIVLALRIINTFFPYLEMHPLSTIAQRGVAQAFCLRYSFISPASSTGASDRTSGWQPADRQSGTC